MFSLKIQNLKKMVTGGVIVRTASAVGGAQPFNRGLRKKGDWKRGGGFERGGQHRQESCDGLCSEENILQSRTAPYVAVDWKHLLPGLTVYTMFWCSPRIMREALTMRFAWKAKMVKSSTVSVLQTVAFVGWESAFRAAGEGGGMLGKVANKGKKAGGWRAMNLNIDF